MIDDPLDPNPYAPPDAPLDGQITRPLRHYPADRRTLDRWLGALWAIFGGFWLALGVVEVVSGNPEAGPALALTVGLPLTVLGYYLLRKSFSGLGSGPIEPTEDSETTQ